MINKEDKIAWFKENRLELFNYINDVVHPLNNKFKLVHAPVKSGKRGMVEISYLLEPESEHIFLSALHRKADKTQRDEISSYGIKVFSVNNKNKKDNCIKSIDESLFKNKKIIIHLDELDFGCGDKQLLFNIWNKYKTNPNVYFVLYSATIEVAKKEFLVFNNISDFYECERYIPPPSYFGIKQYLQNKKFIQAESFINYDEINQLNITEQGEELIKTVIDNANDNSNKRHIGILRLAGNFKIGGKVISQFEKIKEYKDCIEKKYNIRLKFVGSNDNTVEWDNYKYWEELAPNLPFIIIINQVSGRSTEWKCHPFIVWYHTLRTNDTPIGTIIQDQERPVYYLNNYTDDINLEIYGDVHCAKYSAGQITLMEMQTTTNKKFNHRLDTRKKKKHITVEKPEYYDSWDKIPEEYKERKNLTTHVNDDNILKHKMCIMEKINKVYVKKEYEIPNWNKYSHLEGFYMTNMRSSRNNFIKGKQNTKGVWFKSDIEKELNEGIDETIKIRINLVYCDGETDPNNYKFIVRRFKESRQANFSNKTMYNT
jgi:hypothetical protein